MPTRRATELMIKSDREMYLALRVFLIMINSFVIWSDIVAENEKGAQRDVEFHIETKLHRSSITNGL